MRKTFIGDKMKYDIVFGKNGNGRIKITRFPDGEHLVTILNDVKGKEILYITNENKPMFGHDSLDWIFTLGACIQNGAKRVDVIFDFHKNSYYNKEFLMQLAKSTGAKVIR